MNDLPTAILIILFIFSVIGIYTISQQHNLESCACTSYTNGKTCENNNKATTMTWEKPTQKEFTNRKPT